MESRIFARAVAVLSCVMAAASLASAADVSEADFNALKDLVRQQGEAMQKLADEVHKLQQNHDTDQQTHQKDLEQIRELQQKLEVLQQAATNVQKQAVFAAEEVQPIPRVPIDEATVNHNFSILGDAEFQFAKTEGQHAAFLLADFAPIFLYRGGDNVLFEAGFDFILQNNAPNSPGTTTTVNLSFAQLDYLLNDYVTIAA